MACPHSSEDGMRSMHVEISIVVIKFFKLLIQYHRLLVRLSIQLWTAMDRVILQILIPGQEIMVEQPQPMIVIRWFGLLK